jgi:membrane-bound lytic murein transglycosylase D
MPDETRDYVLKIFAAAVIGHNPRLFGLDMDNPLTRYMEDEPVTAARGGE